MAAGSSDGRSRGGGCTAEDEDSAAADAADVVDADNETANDGEDDIGSAVTGSTVDIAEEDEDRTAFDSDGGGKAGKFDCGDDERDDEEDEETAKEDDAFAAACRLTLSGIDFWSKYFNA